MGQNIEPFDVQQFFAENARRRHRASLAERLAGWIQDYGERGPWDAGDGQTQPGKTPVPTDAVSSSASAPNGKSAQDKSKAGKDKAAKARAPRTPGPTAADFSVDDQLDGAASSPLFRLLDQSGNAINQRRTDLQKGANEILKNLVSRNYADGLAAANILRVWIGVGWALMAGWLYVQTTNAKIAGADATSAGLAVGDAATMALIFAVMALLAAITGLAPLGLASAKKAFSNDAIIKASDDYGRWVASILMEFDRRLQGHRDQLGDQGLSDTALLRAVSLAHITAEEAVVLFKEMSFLTDQETDLRSSTDAYRHYLNQSGQTSASATGMAAGLLGFIFGAAAGISLGGVVLSQALGLSPGRVLDKLGIEPIGGFEQYPLAFLALLMPAGLLLAAGQLGDLFTFAAMRGERDRRLAESLTTVRSAITAAQAPRARDIAQRVDDLSEIFRARLAKTAGNHGAVDDLPAPSPSWRQRDTTRDQGPRFVNTGFTAAPKPFLADIHAPRNGKNIGPVRETKRGLFGLGKPRAR